MNRKVLKANLLYDLYKQMEYNKFLRKFYRLYPENEISPQNVFPLEILTVGKKSYGDLNVVTFNNLTKLHIGNYVSIAQNVHFILDAEHYINHISTFPFKVKCLHELQYESFSKGDIYVEDDVWIGHGSTIMSGVTLGQGCVIAASSVVTKDVEPYTVVGGIPAKKIKQRFPDEISNVLENLDFSKLGDREITEYSDLLYKSISGIDDLEIITQFVKRIGTKR